jgi:quercetin dioxygenase-like cupin family protein
MISKLACAAILVFLSFYAGVQNGKRISKNESRIEIENDRVVVRRNLRLPHAFTPMHSHREGVVIYLSDVHERSTALDGTSKEVSHKAGEVVWAPAREHALQNLENTKIEVIEVELKEP